MVAPLFSKLIFLCKSWYHLVAAGPKTAFRGQLGHPLLAPNKPHLLRKGPSDQIVLYHDLRNPFSRPLVGLKYHQQQTAPGIQKLDRGHVKRLKPGQPLQRWSSFVSEVVAEQALPGTCKERSTIVTFIT